MEEALLNGEADDDLRRLAPRRQALQQLRIDRQLRCTVDPEGLGIRRHDEEKPDLRIGEDVLQTEEQLVALAVGNQQGLAVLDDDEARIIALGRGLLMALCIGVESTRKGERRMKSMAGSSSSRSSFTGVTLPACPMRWRSAPAW
jgi:hypothetical protein